MSVSAVRSVLDVVGAVLYAVLVTATVLRADPGTAVRIALGVPLLLLVPGYVLVALLYPERHTGASVSDESPMSRPKDTTDGVSTVGRLGLSLAASLAIVPTVAFVLHFAIGNVALAPVLTVTCGITAILGLTAVVARARLPPDTRYQPPSAAEVATSFSRYFRSDTTGLVGPRPFEATSEREVLFNVALAAAVVLLFSSVAIGFTVPDQGDDFSEFYLVTESDDGEYVPAAPGEFEGDDDWTLSPTIANEEGTDREYTVVVLHQEVDRDGDEMDVDDEEELDRFTRTVADGETERVDHEVSPPETGEDHRLVYLLYADEPPEDPSQENAYRHVQLWTTGDEQQGGSAEEDS